MITILVSLHLGEMPATAQAQVPANDRARGLVYDGLRPGRPDGPCAGLFELDNPGPKVSCTHGPDPIPALTTPATDTATTDALTTPPFSCAGAGGGDAYRVQVLFVRGSDVADQYPAVESTVLSILGGMDGNLNASAAETGGNQHIRFVADASCVPTVTRVVVPAAADDTFNAMTSELRKMGYNRTDRKYFVIADSAVYCGIGEVRNDDSPSATPGANRNNGHPQEPGLMARIDRQCWNDAAGLHELTHTLGGVQTTAPHATKNHHCTDGKDQMCYADAPGVVLQDVCPASHQYRLDCNHDDYFSTNPPAGNYLATHWNLSNSAFLSPVTAPVGPGNDNLAGAQLLQGKAGRAEAFPNTGATKETGEPDHAGFPGGSSIWFTWTAPIAARVAFDTVGTRLDTLLAVYTGSSYANLALVAADDDGSGYQGTSRLAFQSVVGRVYRIAVDGKSGVTGIVSLSWNYSGQHVDFDGDGDADVSVYRNGAWFAQGQPTGFIGTATDIPVPGDYDGDGDTDRSVYRDGTWFTEAQPTAFLGLPGDVPVPRDYDGDGDMDRAVFRPSIGGWYVDGQAPAFFGLPSDIPVPADYDGDGDVERAVFRPSVGGWYVEGKSPFFLGLPGDIPVPGDYGGNGFPFKAVFRPSVGGWYYEFGPEPLFHGLPGDIPVPADYSGGAVESFTVFRPSVGGWYREGWPTLYLGLNGDIPLPLPQAVYRTFFP